MIALPTMVPPFFEAQLSDRASQMVTVNMMAKRYLRFGTYDGDGIRG